MEWGSRTIRGSCAVFTKIAGSFRNSSSIMLFYFYQSENIQSTLKTIFKDFFFASMFFIQPIETDNISANIH